MTEFFRHCPECGRRFHIKLEDKKMVHSERSTFRLPRTHQAAAPIMSGKFGPTGVATGASLVRQPVIVYEGPPVTIDIEEFQYTYECGHCGHEWSEKHTEQHKES